MKLCEFCNVVKTPYTTTTGSCKIIPICSNCLAEFEVTVGIPNEGIELTEEQLNTLQEYFEETEDM